MELSNDAGERPLEESLRADVERAIVQELRAPLPPALRRAQRRGFAHYFITAKHDAKVATAHGKVRSERDLGPIDKLEGPEA
jgi:hypothetical protein